MLIISMMLQNKKCYIKRFIDKYIIHFKYAYKLSFGMDID